MIKLTTLDRRVIALNAELIERLEQIPETVITLTSGRRVLVAEGLDEVMELVMAYRRAILSPRHLPEEE